MSTLEFDFRESSSTAKLHPRKRSCGNDLRLLSGDVFGAGICLCTYGSIMSLMLLLKGSWRVSSTTFLHKCRFRAFTLNVCRSPDKIHSSHMLKGGKSG